MINFIQFYLKMIKLLMNSKKMKNKILQFGDNHAVVLM